VSAPQRYAIARAEQVNAGAQSIPGALNGAIKHGINAELAAGRERVVLTAHVFLYGTRWTNGEGADLADSGDNTVGGFAEMFPEIRTAQDTRTRISARSGRTLTPTFGS
jgi:hypothetical protein